LSPPPALTADREAAAASEALRACGVSRNTDGTAEETRQPRRGWSGDGTALVLIEREGGFTSTLGFAGCLLVVEHQEGRGSGVTRRVQGWARDRQGDGDIDVAGVDGAIALCPRRRTGELLTRSLTASKSRRSASRDEVDADGSEEDEDDAIAEVSTSV
jgi:hypothetical protein